MGSIMPHVRGGYGFRLGGPFEKWSGLKNDISDVIGRYERWTLPNIPWVVSNEAITEENHPDHFQGAAEKMLSALGIEGISVMLFEDGDEHWTYALVAAEKGEEFSCDPIVITEGDFYEAQQYDEKLSRAVAALGFELKGDIKPSWIVGFYEA